MYILLVVTIAAVLVSFSFNRKKTGLALRLALQKMRRLIIPFGWMIGLAAILMPVLSRVGVWQMLSDSTPFHATAFALAVGSVALLPGAVAFPLGAIFLAQGMAHMAVAAFTTAVMMVGIVTFPVERAYLGTRVALIRNAVGIVISCAVAIGIGAAFGEL
jgi:hypothetical protein